MTKDILLSFLGLEGQTSSSLEDMITSTAVYREKEEGEHVHHPLHFWTRGQAMATFGKKRKVARVILVFVLE